MPENRHGGEVDAPNPLAAERHLPCNVLSVNVPDASEQCRETEREDAALGVTVRWQELCLYLSLRGHVWAWPDCCVSGEKESKCLALHPYFTK